jgi:malonate decarboxylase epsilon subunit
MSTAFLFPGQGAQTPGFLHRLPDHPLVAATLQEASAVLDGDVLALDRDQALASTVAVQLATVIAGVAVARLLQAHGVEPEAVAGLSVGAFSAAIACGALALADGLPLVRLRGRLMQEAYPQGHGLAAIVGLSQRQVEHLVQRGFRREAPVYLANLNGPTQFVIAGARAGVEPVLAAARAAGARKAEWMAVPVPSHCPLLDGVAAALGRAVAGVPMAAPRMDYIEGQRGRPTRDSEVVRADLASNVSHQVRWGDATGLLFERGARLFIELPPGQVLAGLVTFEGARALAAQDTRLDTLVHLARRERQLDQER